MTDFNSDGFSRVESGYLSRKRQLAKDLQTMERRAEHLADRIANYTYATPQGRQFDERELGAILRLTQAIKRGEETRGGNQKW